MDLDEDELKATRNATDTNVSSISNIGGYMELLRNVLTTNFDELYEKIGQLDLTKEII